MSDEPIPRRRSTDRKDSDLPYGTVDPQNCAIHIYRMEALEDRFSDYIRKDEKWKEELALRIDEKLQKLDSLIVEIETSKKLGRILIGVAAAVGAFLTWAINMIHALYAHVTIQPK